MSAFNSAKKILKKLTKVPCIKGKLGKAVKICYGHATVMLLLIHKKLSQIAALVKLYISASDGVYTRTISIAILVSFSV